MTLTEMFADVLKWNVMFGVPIPDDRRGQMLTLLEEEFQEFETAATFSDQADAVGDMLVIALGICARLIHYPQPSPRIYKLAGSKLNNVRVDRRAIQSVRDCLNASTDVDIALNDFIEILFIHSKNNNIDLVEVFKKIMEKNWKKFWTAEEAKKAPSTYSIRNVGGIVVYNQIGKVVKPPSFEHPVHAAPTKLKFNHPK